MQKTDDWTNVRVVHVYPSKVKVLKYQLPTQYLWVGFDHDRFTILHIRLTRLAKRAKKFVVLVSFYLKLVSPLIASQAGRPRGAQHFIC